MTDAKYSRPIVLKSTAGAAIDSVVYSNPTKISAISVRPNKYDVVVKIYDHDDLVWSIEADNGGGSSPICFCPPLRIYHNLRVTADAEQPNGGAFEVCIAVIHP